MKNQEQFHRQLFNGITILSGVLIMIALNPMIFVALLRVDLDNIDIVGNLLSFALCLGVISMLYGWFLIYIRIKTKDVPRLYNTWLSSKLTSILGIFFYFVILVVFVLILMLYLIAKEVI